MNKFSENTIYDYQTVREALARLDKFALKINLTLFVLSKEDKLVGTITDGDIRRGLLAGDNLGDPISKIMHTQFRFIKKNNYTLDQLSEFRKKGISLVPVLDDEGKIDRVISFRDQITLLPLDVVLMAGGIGERLKPLTDNIPKPLLPIGDKPIIEHNIDRLIRFGVDQFIIAVRHMSEKIESYLGNGSEKNINIQYQKEDKPMGTIGALSQVPNFQHNAIIVMNSDLLTNIDYEDFYKKFLEDDASICVASVPYKINVPYAIMELENNTITSLKEKPTYTYYANAGIYLIKKEVLSLIPKNEKFDATELIELAIKKNMKVSTYPILGYWLDIGKHEDYKKAQEDIKHINLYN